MKIYTRHIIVYLLLGLTGLKLLYDSAAKLAG